MKSRALREAVEKADMGVSDLVKETGLSAKSLGTYLKDEDINPRVSSLWRIAVVLSPRLKKPPKVLFKSFFSDDLELIEKEIQKTKKLR
jgi:transcriptional regulator with XRE-family HTH domain